MVKAVIFDLDDTLISEKQYIKSGFHYISSIISMETGLMRDFIYKKLIDLFMQNPINVFNRFYEMNNIRYTNNQIEYLVSEYRSHYPAISFYDDVLPCLGYLKEKAIKTAIITDGYAISQRQKLLALNAYKLFDEIILTDELGREYWKPHPKSFELIKDKFNLDYNNMIYVGDNPEKDFYIGKIYKVLTIRIVREDQIHSNNKYYNGVKEKITINSLSSIRI